MKLALLRAVSEVGHIDGSSEARIQSQTFMGDFERSNPSFRLEFGFVVLLVIPFFGSGHHIDFLFPNFLTFRAVLVAIMNEFEFFRFWVSTSQFRQRRLMKGVLLLSNPEFSIS